MERTTSSPPASAADHGCRTAAADGKRNRRSKKSNSGALKVVYISTPMKVKTSASKFRSIVQELTGKYSDVARYMENNVSFDDHNNDENSWTMSADETSNEGKTTDGGEATAVVDDWRLLLNPDLVVDENVFGESPTSSDEYQFDGTPLDVLPDVDHCLEMNLEGIFGSSFLMESTLDDISAFEDFCLAA